MSTPYTERDSMSANPLLSIEGLTASVDEKTILHNVNLNVAAGET